MMACACFSVNSKPADQAFARFSRRSRRARISWIDFIQMIEGFLEAEQHMFAVARFAEQVVCAAANHVGAMFDESLDDIDNAQLARLPVDDAQHDHAEVHLHLRVLVQIVQNDFGLLAALQLDHDAHAVAIALVANIGDAFDASYRRPTPQSAQSVATC